MSREIQAQVLLLATAISLGFLIGFLFDMYRRLRNITSPGPLATFIGDLGFWLIVTVVAFYLLYKVNFVQVRGYFFLGLGTGLIFYFHFISRHIIHAFVRLNLFCQQKIYKLRCLWHQIKKCKIFFLFNRIFDDAKRIYSKIKRR